MERLNITEKVLDKLGFSEYWDEHGTWGGRTLTFADGTDFRIMELEEMEDDSEGYESDGRYVAHRYKFAGNFAIPPLEGDSAYMDLFFLHEMYECIEANYPAYLPEFTSKCVGVRMGSYIDEFLSYREATNHYRP